MDEVQLLENLGFFEFVLSSDFDQSFSDDASLVQPTSSPTQPLTLSNDAGFGEGHQHWGLHSAQFERFNGETDEPFEIDESIRIPLLISDMYYTDWEYLNPTIHLLTPTTPVPPTSVNDNPMLPGLSSDESFPYIWKLLKSPEGEVKDVTCFATASPATAVRQPKRRKRVWEPRPSQYELRSGRVQIIKIEKLEQPEEAETPSTKPTLPVAKIEELEEPEEPAQAETPQPMLTRRKAPVANIMKLEEPEEHAQATMRSPLVLRSRTVPEIQIEKQEKAPEGRGRGGNKRTAQPKMVLPLPPFTIDLLNLKTEWTDARKTWKLSF